MTLANDDAMNLDQLREYVLTHREDITAFQKYVDRSKAAGRMITIQTNDPHWEESLEKRIQQAASGDRESN